MNDTRPTSSVIDEVLRELESLKQAAKRCGVDRDSPTMDPGYCEAVVTRLIRLLAKLPDPEGLPATKHETQGA